MVGGAGPIRTGRAYKRSSWAVMFWTPTHIVCCHDEARLSGERKDRMRFVYAAVCLPLAEHMIQLVNTYATEQFDK